MFSNAPRPIFLGLPFSLSFTFLKICQSFAISKQTYYKWRREYGGLKIDNGA